MTSSSSQDGLVLMWSGGKDAALALDVLHSQSPRRVGALLTTVVEDTDRVTMHGTPLRLIEHQARVLNLPLHVMRVPPRPSNEVYEARLDAALTPLLNAGFSTVVAGDLFLEDVRRYREDVIEALGARALFPLWQRDPMWLARRFFERGYQAVATSVDTTQLGASFAGRAYDTSFLEALPSSVDPCGEHGAFHTFVTGGPPFEAVVPVAVSGEEARERMHRVHLRPTDAHNPLA